MASLSFCSCKKLVEVPAPSTELSSDNVYTTDATAAAVLTGVYTEIALSSPLLAENIDALSLVSGLSADELTLYGGSANENTALVLFYQNKLSAGLSTAAGSSIWSDFYADIYIVNIALERLQASTTLTPVVKQQLMGEAEFMRAFFYFYLVNLYGDVPLITSSNYTGNATMNRTPTFQVYNQIVVDLNDAQNRLTAGYVGADAMTGTTERVRPNKWSAMALLSRVYLYTLNWDSARTIASQLIDNTSLYRLDTLNGVFLKNSTEAIWQMQPVNTGWNTEDGEDFVLTPAGPTSNGILGVHPVYMSAQLLSGFEPGDVRRTDWVDSVIANGTTYYFPYKYKSATINTPLTEYTMMLRLGEQYLIRAEAEANGAGGGVSAAIADLNVIRNRAGLPGYAGGNDKPDVLAAILHERQVELFTEWGHRWLDLKRNGQMGAVMGMPGNVCAQKGGAWNTDWQWYPLPAYDITQDPNLVQNAGY